MNRRLLAGLIVCGLAGMGCSLLWRAGQFDAHGRTIDEKPREPATIRAMKWCNNRPAGEIDIVQWQKRSGGSDPDVAAGFVGHDREELEIAEAINEQFDLSNQEYRAIASHTSGAIADAYPSNAPEAAALKSREIVPQFPPFTLPLANLSNADRAGFCRLIASLRETNASLARSHASLHGK